jgi:hypothetical protein
MTLLSESKSNTTRGWNKVFKVYFIKKPLEEPSIVRGSECVKYLKGQELEWKIWKRVHLPAKEDDNNILVGYAIVKMANGRTMICCLITLIFEK